MPVVGRGQFEFKDVFEGFQLIQRSQRWVFWGLTAMGILWTSLSVVNIAAHQGNPIPELPLLLVGIFFATGNWTFAWINTKRVLKTNCFRGEIEFTFGEEGFSAAAPNANSHLQWPGITRWVEGSRVFVLFPHKAMGHVVPKRFFGVSDLDTIRRLLQENVRETK